MEPQQPKVGDKPFSAVWKDVECRVEVIQAEGFETLARLDVLVDGTLQWSSPKSTNPQDDWAFGDWSDGSGMPCLFDDIDGDGRPEVVAMVPKADLSPTVFRVFRWNGHELSLLRKGSLIRNDRETFVWTEQAPEEITQVAWIDYFEGGQAEIVHHRRATVSRRTSVVKPAKNGFVEVE